MFQHFNVASFVTGLFFAFAISFVYNRTFRSLLFPLRGFSGLKHDDSDPLFTLLNNLPDSVYIKDNLCRYVIANENFANQLKIGNVFQLIGKKDTDLYPEEVAKKYFNEDMQILNGEIPEIHREQKSEKNGKIKVTSTYKIPLKNKSGQIIGLVGLFSDITDTYLVTEKLRKQNEIIEKERKLLRALMDNMPDTIYIKDTNGCFLDVNPLQVAVTKGKSREEMIGKTDYNFYPKDIADIFNKDDMHVIKTGEAVINKEEIGFAPDGNIRVKLTTKVPFFNDDGNVAGLVGIGRDISKIKETEEKLIEQTQHLQEINVLLEERQEEINQQSDELSEQNKILEAERTLLRTLIDNLPDSIYIKDTHHRFITVNKYLLELLNINDLKDIEGKTDRDFFPKEMAEKYARDEDNLIQTGNPIVDMEETSLDKHGNIIYLHTTKVPIRNVDGKVTGIVGIGQDITALKETEMKLMEQAEYLKEVNVLLEERQEEIQQQAAELSSQNILLENEKNLLRVLIDTLQESIFIKDTESRFITVNKAILKNLRLNSLSEVEGKTDYDFYKKNDADEYFNDEREILRSNKPIYNKEEIRFIQGGIKRYKSVSKVPFFDEQGRPLGIVGISKDITELKNIQNILEKKTEDLQQANVIIEERAEEIEKQKEWLAEQNERIEKERTLLRTLIDNIPDYIYIKDSDSRFITVNQKLLRTMHANSLDEVIGKNDFDTTPYKEIAEAYYTDEQKILNTGEPIINKEEIGFDENGREKVISTTKVPFRDTDGQIIGIVGVGRDITKQKNIERKLREQAESLKEVNTLLEERQEKIQIQSDELNRQASELKITNKQLEELNATKNKFFSIIAHDLKNPFQAIFGFSELLMRNFEDFEENQRYELLTMIKTSSESAYNLLENLLQWARTQTDRIKYSPSEIDIKDLLKQNITLAKANIDKKSILIRTDTTCAEPIWADFNMTNLIIRNLLSNAIKFTPNNGIITLGCSRISQLECEIFVQDTGIGMSEENVKKLFRIDEYFSTSGTAGESGTGLGLIICKEFIEKNNGKLTIESELDKGTTFRFTLPIATKIY
jgi:PAS domain S-box-containing protein